MSKVTILLLRLLLCSLTSAGTVIVPHSFAYADSGEGGDSDGGGEDGGGENGHGDTESGPAENDDDDDRNEPFFQKKSKKSHQRSIRKAVQTKQILPLRKIMRLVKRKTRSEIIKIELEHKKRGWIYEFKVVDQKGRLRELYVDATNGAIIKSKKK